MKVVILAGGFGTRLSEYTDIRPKPMVEIGGYPILWHIMKIYSYYGFNDFAIALGYKGQVIKEYFLNYQALNSDFKIDLENGSIEYLNSHPDSWKVSLVDTGSESMTGGRVKQLSKLIDDEPFMLTYGDGVADINISQLMEFHKSHGKLATVTAVNPKGRYGELQIKNDCVEDFIEKPRFKDSWINGGFFVFQPEFLDMIAGDSTVLEREPLEKLVRMGELMTFKHKGFWQCMDTLRDRNYLDQLWEKSNAKWKVWDTK
jgi:glucose-1-phosphate cytidylyltransferase